jgi:hypothetical protein
MALIGTAGVWFRPPKQRAIYASVPKTIRFAGENSGKGSSPRNLLKPRTVAQYEDQSTPKVILSNLTTARNGKIFPGDLEVTLNELKLVRIDDPASSHALVSGDDNSSVRVLPAGEKWPVDQVRTVLKDNS